MPNTPPAKNPPADASLKELDEQWGFKKVSDLVGTAHEQAAAVEAA